MTHSTPTPATFTPTHTAEGRKLTRAERKAANKAKWAAMQAAKAAERKAKPKTIVLPPLDPAVWEQVGVTPKPKRKGKGKQASKPKSAKAKAVAKAEVEAQREARAEERRLERQERKAAYVEARAQRESIRKQEARRAKENEGSTIVVGADGGEAQVCERRMEVPAPPKRERKPLTFDGPDFADFDGLTVEEAANLAKEQFFADITADDCL